MTQKTTCLYIPLSRGKAAIICDSRSGKLSAIYESLIETKSISEEEANKTVLSILQGRGESVPAPDLKDIPREIDLATTWWLNLTGVDLWISLASVVKTAALACHQRIVDTFHAALPGKVTPQRVAIMGEWEGNAAFLFFLRDILGYEILEKGNLTIAIFGNFYDLGF